MFKVHRPLSWSVAMSALAAFPAAAHEGDHGQMGLAEAVHHVLTEPDHLAMLAFLVTLAIGGGWLWLRRGASR